MSEQQQHQGKIEENQPQEYSKTIEQTTQKIQNQEEIQQEKPQPVNQQQQEEHQQKPQQKSEQQTNPIEEKENPQEVSLDSKNLQENEVSAQQKNQEYRVPPTPQQLLVAEEEAKEKQKLINEIMKMYDDFQRLEIRSEELQQENKYFIDKIQEFEKIIYQDEPVQQ